MRSTLCGPDELLKVLFPEWRRSSKQKKKKEVRKSDGTYSKDMGGNICRQCLGLFEGRCIGGAANTRRKAKLRRSPGAHRVRRLAKQALEP